MALNNSVNGRQYRMLAEPLLKYVMLKLMVMLQNSIPFFLDTYEGFCF